MSTKQEIPFDERPVALPAKDPADMPETGTQPDGEPGDDSNGVSGKGVGDAAGDAFHEMISHNFISFASYVIRERAIPALEDGLKPVQRRILHAMHEMDDGRFTKVATVVGRCMEYHPHGDQSITDALVGLANRGNIIEAQGNFGNVITGDPAAASRYIECRLTQLARDQLFNKAVTTYKDSYDGRKQEPVVLPARIPLLLMMGADGIAVGLATRILPHNFGELIQAQIAFLQGRSFEIFPDFVQGGLMDVSEYDHGVGRIRLRARIAPGENQTLSIREIPFSTTTESLIASIEDASRRKKVPVTSINDYTAEEVNIELKLGAEADPDKAIQTLYAFTQCEVGVASRPVVIRGNRPVEIAVDDILRENTDQLVRILRRELKFRKREIEEEIHTKTLVRIFVENRIYKRIEECGNYAAVVQAVHDGLAPFAGMLRRPPTAQDVEMLLGIRIKRISRFDMEKNTQEIAEHTTDLQRVEKDLSDVTAYAIRYLRALLKRHGAEYPRRTEIQAFKSVEVKTLTARELALRYDPEKRHLGHKVEGKEVLQCSSYDKVIVVWRDGRYQVQPPPERMFVDDLVYCAVADRDRVITLVYECYGFTYVKRFTFGGAIMNKQYYCCGGKDTKVLLLEDSDPMTLYVRYKPAERQMISQQYFTLHDLAVTTAKAKGPVMTMKAIEKISTEKPRWWDDTVKSIKGIILK